MNELLNAFVANISKNIQQALQGTNVDCEYDPSKINNYVDSRVPQNVHFKIPKMTLLDLINNIKSLNATRATGLDGLPPRILKLAADVIAPSLLN